MTIIDLRSDTVTLPTQAMRDVMASAPVGDDVYGEDPSVNLLEDDMAKTLGKEAGLFIASGTMGNLVALLAHAGRGDEVILGDLSHTFLYEGGGVSALGSIHPHQLPNEVDGTLDPRRIQLALRNPDDPHAPRTRMIVLENTHNRCGGIALTAQYCNQVAQIAGENGLIMHLDGARLFNAAIALGCAITDLTHPFDSVTVCLSKGLGAPVGSVLCGSRAFIHEAHRMRKLVGGGMRQAGILAAAGLYALDHHVERLAEDHKNAATLARGISQIDGLHCPQAEVPATGAWTNLVYFSVDGAAIGRPQLDAIELSKRLKAQGVLAHALGSDGKKIRMVTHLNIDSSDIEATLATLRSCLSGT
ncbi:MAG: low-specificity L-threonine aldolase [Candidatus Atribacteria bacterium]|nr:MAG: low-specificity L-threonine aldolase [Candidatus Atribacteria bacterium]